MVAIPIAAVGVMGKTTIDRERARQELVDAGAVNLALPEPMAGPDQTDQAFTTGEPIDADLGADMGAGTGSERFAALDGQSAESSGDGVTVLEMFLRGDMRMAAPPYAAFTNYALGKAGQFEAGGAVDSVVLEPRFDIDKPKMISCKGKPLAVLIDLDDKDLDMRWASADTLYLQPGLVETVRELRAAEISIIWLSDVPTMASATVAAALDAAGLSAPEGDDFLFLDRGPEDRKQMRRWEAAQSYCIIAAAGDERADFDELYTYLLDPDAALALRTKFDQGWFITPPPLIPQEALGADRLATLTAEDEEDELNALEP